MCGVEMVSCLTGPPFFSCPPSSPPIQNPHFPNSLILHHPPLRIGVLHGHQIVPAGDVDSLCSVARAMDVDLLVTGHTHRFDAFEKEGRFFVNPGSATGAWCSVWPVKEGEENEPVEDAKKADESKEGTKADKEETQGKATGADEEKKDGEAQSGENGGKDKADGDAAAPETDSKTEPIPAADPTPSFACECAELGSKDRERCALTTPAVLDVQGPVVVTYVYQLIEGEVKVEKMEFRKKLDSNSPTPAGQRRAVGTARS